MSTDVKSRPRAEYRFDPHTGGIFLGLGRVRLAALLAVLALGVFSLYGGKLLLAVLLMGVAPIFVLWTREGIPALLWIPLRIAYRLRDSDRRGWSLDPELVPHTDPLAAAATSSSPETPEV